ncbi:WLM-domain-containing protein [Pilatotrama ljubarskyi]|nr:WLM-domain-containing protein [Pilatotrama ljubarskyi]
MADRGRSYINAGQKILVRLRPAHAPDTFYDEEDIVRTMLHELTHNVHGPHDDKFYALLSTLEDEYAALRAAGYSGEGFHANGRRLGTNVSHDLPPHIARQKAVEAAENRRKIAVVLGRGGKLGGAAKSTKSLRELTAEAAERRARDEKTCGSGALAHAEAEKAAKESVRDDVIDLTADDSDDSSPEPEFIVIDDDSPQPSHWSSPSSSAASTPTTSRPAPRPQAESVSSNGYLSSSSASSQPSSSGARTPASGTRTPASWSGLRPEYASSYSSSSSLAPSAATSSLTPSSTSYTSSSTTQLPLQAAAVRPSVRRVERGAGPGTPKLPKPRSLSRPAQKAKAAHAHHAHAHAPVPPHSPATPPPTRMNSVAVSRRHSARSLEEAQSRLGEEQSRLGEEPEPEQERGMERAGGGRGGGGGRDAVPGPGLAVPVIPPEREWACPRCTLVNDALALQCAACLLLRPVRSGSRSGAAEAEKEKDGAETWTCDVCGERGIPREFWTCRFCGSVKLRS